MNKRIKKKRLTANQAQYERQIQRLSRRTFPKLSMQGVSVDYSLLEEKNFQRISHKRIEMLRKVNARDVQTYYDFERYVLEAEAQANYRKQQKQSRENKEKYPEDLSFTPDTSIIDEIKERIIALPESSMSRFGAKYDVPISVRKNVLLEILDEALMENDEVLAEYVEHLKRNKKQIFDGLDRIQYASKDEQITNSFIEVGNILNWGVISENLSEQLSTMSEYA